MATITQDLIPMFNREINVPNSEQILGLSAANKIGYIEDGFWDARLSGMLTTYTVVDGLEVVPPATAGKNYFVDIASKAKDLPTELQMMVVIIGGFRLLRLKIMGLAVNFTAEAGPVSFEQQASATVLRSLLANLQGRIQELKKQYSDEFGNAGFFYMDGVAQAAVADMQNLAELSVIL